MQLEAKLGYQFLFIYFYNLPVKRTVARNNLSAP